MRNCFLNQMIAMLAISNAAVRYRSAKAHDVPSSASRYFYAQYLVLLAFIQLCEWGLGDGQMGSQCHCHLVSQVEMLESKADRTAL
jgi:hypothetical protein